MAVFGPAAATDSENKSSDHITQDTATSEQPNQHLLLDEDRKTSLLWNFDATRASERFRTSTFSNCLPPPHSPSHAWNISITIPTSFIRWIVPLDSNGLDRFSRIWKNRGPMVEASISTLVSFRKKTSVYRLLICSNVQLCNKLLLLHLLWMAILEKRWYADVQFHRCFPAWSRISSRSSLAHLKASFQCIPIPAQTISLRLQTGRWMSHRKIVIARWKLFFRFRRLGFKTPTPIHVAWRAHWGDADQPLHRLFQPNRDHTGRAASSKPHQTSKRHLVTVSQQASIQMFNLFSDRARMSTRHLESRRTVTKIKMVLIVIVTVVEVFQTGSPCDRSGTATVITMIITPLWIIWTPRRSCFRNEGHGKRTVSPLMRSRQRWARRRISGQRKRRSWGAVRARTESEDMLDSFCSSGSGEDMFKEDSVPCEDLVELEKQQIDWRWRRTSQRANLRVTPALNRVWHFQTIPVVRWSHVPTFLKISLFTKCLPKRVL